MCDVFLVSSSGGSAWPLSALQAVSTDGTGPYAYVLYFTDPENISGDPGTYTSSATFSSQSDAIQAFLGLLSGREVGVSQVALT